MIVKSGVVVYGSQVELKNDAAYGNIYGNKFMDTTTRNDNAEYYDVNPPFPFFGGWYSYDGTNFEITENGLIGYKKWLKEQLKNIARKIEFGGIDVNGKKVSTDFASQQYVNGMYSSAQLNSQITVKFHYADDTWGELDATGIEEIATAVSEHVEACFSRRHTVTESIESATTLEDLQNIFPLLHEGWPEILPIDSN